VFVYDGNEGGAGFAERGFAVAREWLTATAEAITSCECLAGCPSCIQSPKCGSGNDPLAKQGALLLLRTLLAHAQDPPTAVGGADGTITHSDQPEPIRDRAAEIPSPVPGLAGRPG